METFATIYCLAAALFMASWAWRSNDKADRTFMSIMAFFVFGGIPGLFSLFGWF